MLQFLQHQARGTFCDHEARASGVKGTGRLVRLIGRVGGAQSFGTGEKRDHRHRVGGLATAYSHTVNERLNLGRGREKKRRKVLTRDDHISVPGANKTEGIPDCVSARSTSRRHAVVGTHQSIANADVARRHVREHARHHKRTHSTKAFLEKHLTARSILLHIPDCGAHAHPRTLLLLPRGGPPSAVL